jgi:ABC-type phosphate transport system substrate-binding protein
MANLRRLRLAAAACVLASVATAGAEGDRGYKVVANRDNPVSSIGRKDLSAIFLRRKTEWPDGTTAVPVDQVEAATVRDEFSRDVHGRRASAVKTAWLQIVFSGRGVPPIEKASDEDVIGYVKAKPGAIGYVSAAARTDEVKVLRVGP